MCQLLSTFKQLHDLDIEMVAEDVGRVGHALNLYFYFQQATARPRYLYIKAGNQLEKVYLTEQKQHWMLPFYAERRGKVSGDSDLFGLSLWPGTSLDLSLSSSVCLGGT